MLSFQEILLILLIHWLADFCLQTNEQATQKSTDPIQLGYHVCTYTIVWFLAAYCISGSWEKASLFAIATFGWHFCTDFVTSRIGKSFWEKKDLHNGFCIVGFDQILHYIQLFLAYIWILKQAL